MTEIDLQARRGDASDAELISRVRGGDVSAYGDLFTRHRDAATRLARQLVSPIDADDLVSEGFAKVLNVLLAGGGPDVAFRAYLLTAIRRLHVDKIRATAKATPTDDLAAYDGGEEFDDTVIAGFEGAAAAKAFASLPERWQLVLWHLEIEGQKPADVAPLLGMSPNAVSALAYRAREGLRQAYLQSHSADLGGDECRWTHDRLGAYVRKGLARRDSAKVEAHLETCRSCTAAYLELYEVNTSLAGVIGPMVLGGAATGYLTASAAATDSVLAAALARTREAMAGNGQVALGIAGALGVAGLAAFAVSILSAGNNVGPSIAGGPPTSVITNAPTSLPTVSTTPTHHPKPPSSPSSPVTTFTVVSPPHQPSSGPTSGPTTPVTRPTHPTPPPTTPTGPVTPPPTFQTADMSTKVGFQLGLGLLSPSTTGTLGNLNASVAGIPAGQTATLTVSVLGGTLEQTPVAARAMADSGSRCTINGNTAVCKVTSDSAPLVFKVIGLPVSVSSQIAGPTDTRDPNMNNNYDSRLLGLL
jgi:RNA polymerase sigma factor (sigma-70 family)